MPLEAIKTGLAGARTMVDLMIEIIFDMVNLVLDLMQLMSNLTEAARSVVCVCVCHCNPNDA